MLTLPNSVVVQDFTLTKVKNKGDIEKLIGQLENINEGLDGQETLIGFSVDAGCKTIHVRVSKFHITDKAQFDADNTPAYVPPPVQRQTAGFTTQASFGRGFYGGSK